MKAIAFACFILSAAASVSYQMIWLRYAMTYFGVITPVISAVLSVFMLGLALGILVAGRITALCSARRSLACYAIAEALIGLLALAVPALFKAGTALLLHSGSEDSGGYLLLSCVIITLALLPACTLIGATFPLLMRCLKQYDAPVGMFSFLYYANLVGALLGCLIPLLLIEWYGMAQSLTIIAAMNLMAAALAGYGLHRYLPACAPPAPAPEAEKGEHSIGLRHAIVLGSLGCAALGSEVIWIKAFMPVLGPTVYAFAGILAVYLACTALGTCCQRYAQRTLRPKAACSAVVVVLPACALIPVIGSSLASLEYFRLSSVLSIGFFCICLGYLTPHIIDTISRDDAYKASRAYFYNCMGCVAGPAFSTYVLFPIAGIKGSLIVYAGLLLAISVALLAHDRKWQWKTVYVFLPVLTVALMLRSQEEAITTQGRLFRDEVGYIGAVGQGMHKRLLVNGIGMTSLTTITKNMAHLPMLHRPDAKSALVICFGMGTTLRSLATWPLDHITAVELSRGVTEAFGYFHADAATVLADPRVSVIVDDGRRFLNRSREHYDIIVIDPPPPIDSSGSGLLYTSQFLAIVKQHLAPGGILQQWIPRVATNGFFVNAAVNAVKANFNHVKLYASIEGPEGRPAPVWGIHILASDSPLPERSEQDFLALLPARAAQDVKEWQGAASLEDIARRSLRRVDEQDLLKQELRSVVMSDDRLYNEFFLLRNGTRHYP